MYNSVLWVEEFVLNVKVPALFSRVIHTIELVQLNLELLILLKDMNIQLEHVPKQFMIKVEVAHLLELILDLWLTIKLLNNYSLPLKVCIQVNKQYVVRMLNSQSVMFYQSVTFQKVHLFVMLKKRTEIVVHLLDNQVATA